MNRTEKIESKIKEKLELLIKKAKEITNNNLDTRYHSLDEDKHSELGSCGSCTACATPKSELHETHVHIADFVVVLSNQCYTCPVVLKNSERLAYVNRDELILERGLETLVKAVKDTEEQIKKSDEQEEEKEKELETMLS